tara:strand:- start:263 stop:829 length:567 start_codon:yes stop_codon:yes gene_type:complete
MRIISGIAKGKKLLIPLDKKTRPLKDMVRGAIFNIINHSNLIDVEIDQCKILDLFSGVGSFGLEAISRGAKEVVFFENYKPTLKLLMKNIDNLEFSKKVKVYNQSIYTKNIFEKIKKNFNIIFLDPPYRDKSINIILENLFNSKLLNSKTLIIIHRHNKTFDKFEKKFKIARQEIYGSSKILFGYFNI